MKKSYVLGLIFALSVMPSLPRLVYAGSQSVVISEVAWAGSAKSTADEWIEIANIGTATVDVSGWNLTGVGSSGAILSIPIGTILNAQSTYLIANYKMGNSSSTLNIEPNMVTTTVSIPNTALKVSLIDTTGSIIDSFDDPGTPDFGSSTTFSTMERNLYDLTWRTANTSTNLLNGQLGTPGAIDYVLIVIPEPAVTPIEVPVEVLSPIVAAEQDAVVPIIEAPLVPPIAPSLITTSEDTVPLHEVSEDTVNGGMDDLTATASTDVVNTAIVAVIDVPVIEPSPNIDDPVTVPDLIVASPIALETPDVIIPIIETMSAEAPLVPPINGWMDDLKATATTDAVNTVTITAVIEPIVITTPIPSEPEATPITEPQPITSEPIVIAKAPMTQVGDIVISALLPSPNTGDSEWVQLTNSTDAVIDLTGFSLVDASGAVTYLSGMIAAHATVQVNNPKGNLNNSGDSVTLFNSANVTIDSVSYGNGEVPAPKKGEVLTFNPIIINTNSYDQPTDTVSTSEQGEYATSTTIGVIAKQVATVQPSTVVAVVAPSPAHDSVRTAVSVVKVANTTKAATASLITPIKTRTEVVKTSVTKTKIIKASTKRKAKSLKSKAVIAVTIDEINSVKDGTLVSIEGVVVAEPGVIGKRSFFIDGLEIYQSKDALADVHIGDKVKIIGTVSVLSDRRRINIKAGGVTVIGVTDEVVRDYDNDLSYGSLVKMAGTVSARAGNGVILQTENMGNITLMTAQGVNVTWTNLAGKEVTVTGILKSSGASPVIVLRSANDVAVKAMNTDSSSSMAATTGLRNNPWLWPGLGSMSLTGLGYWMWKYRPQITMPGFALKPQTI